MRESRCSENPKNRGETGHFSKTTDSNEMVFGLALDILYICWTAQKKSGHLDNVAVALVHVCLHMT